MKITVLIEDKSAIVAIAHSLSYGEDIGSKKKCLQEVKSYIGIYGESCIADHEVECSQYMNKAKELFHKYFTK
jgi:hypothetical protein